MAMALPGADAEYVSHSPGTPLETPSPSAGEDKARAGNEVFYGARDEHVAGCRFCGDSGADVYRQTANRKPVELDLAGVDADAHIETQSAGIVAKLAKTRPRPHPAVSTAKPSVPHPSPRVRHQRRFRVPRPDRPPLRIDPSRQHRPQSSLRDRTVLSLRGAAGLSQDSGRHPEWSWQGL